MATNDTRMTPADLDALLGLARAQPPQPSEALIARVMADAETALAGASRTVAPAGRRPAPRRSPVLAQLAAALGGWGGIGGLLTASFAGLWLGLSGVGADTASTFWAPDAAATAADLQFLPDTDSLLTAEN